MIKYISTRGSKKLYSFSEVILKGIADDSGLFVPKRIPKIIFKDLKKLCNKSYQEIAIYVFNLFKIDFSKKKIVEIVNKGYSSNFSNSKITPIIHLKENQYILELWHGPTSAFKDMALQVMSLFFLEAVKRNNKLRINKREKTLNYLILTATSGDTGKAALEGYKNMENISIVVFYPDKYVSKLQELQMITQEGANVFVYAVNGNFDETQRLVKDIFNDQEFSKKLINQYQTVLSSANSINWGRLLPQIVYHINAYLQLVNNKIIKLGEYIDIAVPTGNFGNILAAYYAKKMGLPIRKLICASNENNVLTDFLQTGIYDINKRRLIQTSSPSMDILIASNIERLLYLITKSSTKVNKWMDNLNKEGGFKVDEKTKNKIQKEFYADWVSNKDCLDNIKNIYKETKYLLDPHTSVAEIIAKRYIKKKNVSVPVVVCSTAHWSKFAKDIYKTLTNENEINLDEFLVFKKIKSLDANLFIPESIIDLQIKSIRHKSKCEAKKEDVENILINYLQLQNE